jgi:3-methyladenine DNA glycosylase AlkD
LLAIFIDDPALVSAAQMDRWCREFDSWAVCDTACFHLFARTPHAWRKVAQWSRRRDEFVKRAAFALLASLCLHDKKAGDDSFIEGLRLVEQAADDERNFVKKAVNWALRTVGKRNPQLHAAAVTVAQRLAASESATPRWVGKDALRDLASPATAHRLVSSRQAR